MHGLLFYIHELSFYRETEIITFSDCIPNQKAEVNIHVKSFD